MKKLHFLLLLSISALLFSCGGEKAFIISGITKKLEGKTIYLQKFEKGLPKTIDSTIIKEDGTFELRPVLQHTDYYLLTIDDKNNLIIIADSVGSLAIVAEDNIGKPSDIKGQNDTKLLYEFGDKVKELIQKGDSITKLREQGIPEIDVLMKFNQFNQDAVAYLHQFIDKNYTSPAALAALNRLNPVTELTYFVKVRDALSGRMQGSEYMNHLNTQIDRAGAEAKAVRQLEEQAAANDQMIPAGSMAPDLTIPDPLGKKRSLSEYRGKVVLLDFWASWCKPCRLENPTLVLAYKEFHTKGFEIFSVSLDRSDVAWKNAIRQDALTWTHVSELSEEQSKAAETYGVRSIPFNVLIDKEGKVIAKNLRGQNLLVKLKEVLG